MKFKTFLVLVMFISFFKMNAQNQKEDVLHFSAGILSGAAGAFVASELSDGNRFWTFTGALAGSLLAGTIKETIDEKNYGGWDNRDLGATFLGGLTVGITIDVFSGKKRKRQQRQFTVGAPLYESSFLVNRNP
jgi:hypothetical protein